MDKLTDRSGMRRGAVLKCLLMQKQNERMNGHANVAFKVQVLISLPMHSFSCIELTALNIHTPSDGSSDHVKGRGDRVWLQV